MTSQKSYLGPFHEDLSWQLALRSLFENGDIMLPESKMNHDVLQILKLDGGGTFENVVIGNSIAFLEYCGV